jgi:hypothetical protein
VPLPFIPSSDEQIGKAIDALKGLSLSEVSIDEVKQHIQVLLTGHSLSVPIFDPPIKLHRARKMNILPSSLKEIGAPPAEKVLCNQRCNRAGESFFYCSSARNAPFFEIHAEVGDRIVISEWQTTKKMTVNHVGYTSANFARLQSGRASPDWSKATPSFKGTERTRLVDEFLSSYFSVDVRDGQEHLYTATIAITEKLIPIPTVADGFPFDGLMYPTMPMSGNCENFALRPDFVERAVAFSKAEYVTVKAIEGMKMDLGILDFANSVQPDGNLNWKGRPGKWTVAPGRTVRVSVEHGEYVVHDEDGNPVSMD